MNEEGSTIRVLIVDSHQAFVSVATDFFRRDDEVIVVGTVSGRKEALAQAEELRPQVILMDFDHLLGPKGMQIIPRLRTILPDVSIIVVAVLDIGAYRRAALRRGADDFVSKFNLTTDLLPAVRRAARTARPGLAMSKDASPSRRFQNPPTLARP